MVILAYKFVDGEGAQFLIKAHDKAEEVLFDACVTPSEEQLEGVAKLTRKDTDFVLTLPVFNGVV